MSVTHNKTVEDGVKSLLKANGESVGVKWEYREKKPDDMTDSLIIDGKAYPIFYWRYDPQVQAIARNAKFNIGGSVSAKTTGLIKREYGIEAYLYKELDAAEWILDSDIKKITATLNKNAAAVILKMENGKVATLELGAALPEGAEEQTRHTAWGREGMESTRVVSTKVRPQSVYVFTDSKTPYTYNDTTLELYGLTLEQSTIAVSIYKMLTEVTDYAALTERDGQLRKYIEIVRKSDITGESVEL